MAISSFYLSSMARVLEQVILSAFFITSLALTVKSIFGMHVPSPLFPSSRSWQDAVAAKVAADNAKIPEEWLLDREVIDAAKSRSAIAGDFIESLLDNQTYQITSMDVPDLLQAIGEKRLKAVEVVTAFCKRAAFAHQLSNLLLEIGFDIALRRAQELDDYFEKHGKLIGPLHGIPLTLKDQFHIKGLETSMAFVGWIGTFEGKTGTGKERVLESQLIKELHALGAVPIGKTTLVQSIWAPETNNNILGYAWNPYNQRLSTGGSSGGEGAMQALRGSAFGIGTDIGGSVSMPASFQGVFSLKPSAGRLSFKDVANTGRGQEIMPTVAGIMAHSVATLQLVFRSLISTEPWLNDPYCLPIPWRSEKEYDSGREKLPAFGFMPNDGLVSPHPPIARALNIVQKALEESGYQLLDWNPPSNNESIEIHGPIARGDGCPDVYDAIRASGEPIVPEIAHLFPSGKLKPPIPLPEYEQVVLHMKDFRARWNEYWASSAKRTTSALPVQAVISPVTPYAAVLPGKFYHSPYTSVLNVLDYTGIVLPITFAQKEIDTVDPNFEPLTEKDKMNMDSYDAEVYHGAPAAIQLIGRRLDEERLLSMAELVVKAVEKYKAKHGEMA
ncbi:amidase signature domain-containing protein [Nemania sp. FL0031]|nr:amidase signature domain-containing protein [Nemania sp. FL0031]